MSSLSGSVTFAMTGVLHSNGRAIRQIRLLQGLAERVDVVAGDAEAAVGLFDDNVRLHGYNFPESASVRFFWDVHTAVKRIVRTLESDVYHASDLYVLPAVAGAARSLTRPVVYDARELYPFVQGTVGRPWATLFWHTLEARYARRADVILTVNDSIAERIERAYEVKRPIVVHNVPDRSEVHPSNLLRTSLPIDEDALVVLHLGHMRAGRGCDVLVRAMKLVQGAALAFVGSGPEHGRLEQLARDEGVESVVHFVEPVPYDRVLDVAAGADVGASLLEDTCLNHRLALPNKVFEYLMAGLPVIVSDFPELGPVALKFDVGLAVDPASPGDVARAIQRMVDDTEGRMRWKANAPAVLKAYSWSKSAERMARAYRDLGVGAGPGTKPNPSE